MKKEKSRKAEAHLSHKDEGGEIEAIERRRRKEKSKGEGTRAILDRWENLSAADLARKPYF